MERLQRMPYLVLRDFLLLKSLKKMEEVSLYLASVQQELTKSAPVGR